MSELKPLPCPFCGGAPRTVARPDNIDGTRFFYALACYCGGYSACAHKMAVEPTPEQAKRTAIEAWNRRAQPAQAGQVLTDDQWQRIADITESFLTRDMKDEIEAVLAKRVPMPPEDWSVFNSGAEVASGLTWAEAWDYMTPSRIERGWTAVCVADKSNIGIVGEKGGA